MSPSAVLWLSRVFLVVFGNSEERRYFGLWLTQKV